MRQIKNIKNADNTTSINCKHLLYINKNTCLDDKCVFA